MQPIRTRRDLAGLLERQMTAASRGGAAAAADDDIEARTALKTYLLEAHGRMRAEPYAALGDVAAAAGLSVEPTEDPALIALAQGDLQFWLDTSDPRYLRLHTNASAKDADRVHESLVHASPLLEPAWIAPSRLEALARRVDGRMVLFSLRHDRRPLRKEADDGPDGVDLVTLRFWAPAAADTLARLRLSDVLPRATSVASVRVRAGSDDAYALVEAYHNGKFTAVGSSFAELERVLRAVTDDAAAIARALESADGARTLRVPVKWAHQDLATVAQRMFAGADPFRLWGLPHRVGEQTFRARAVDLGVARAAEFEVSPEGVAVELPAGTPASVAVRLVSGLQYHVNSDIRCDALDGGALLAPASARALPAYDERSPMDVVARAVLAEACAQWVRGLHTMTAVGLAQGVLGKPLATPAAADLARRVMNEAAAFEWHEWLKPVLAPDSSTVWRWASDLPIDHALRLRELARLNRHARELVLRVAGGIEAPWMQLSLFGAEALVPPVAEE